MNFLLALFATRLLFMDVKRDDMKSVGSGALLQKKKKKTKYYTGAASTMRRRVF